MTKQERLELEFLRFFYDEVSSVIGPASDDVYYLMKKEYEEEGFELPEDYK